MRDKVNEANEAVIAIRRVKAQLEDRYEQSDDARCTRAGDKLDKDASAVEADIYQVKNQSGQDPLNFPIKVNNRLANLMSMAERGRRPAHEQHAGDLRDPEQGAEGLRSAPAGGVGHGSGRGERPARAPESAAAGPAVLPGGSQLPRDHVGDAGAGACAPAPAVSPPNPTDHDHSLLPRRRRRAAFPVAALLLLGGPTLHGSPAPAAAQEPVDLAMVERIRVEATEGSHAWTLYQTLTDVMGPRLTGSPGYLRAAEWARERLDEWGAANAHLEPFEFGRGWTLEGLTLEMTAPRYFPLTGYPEAWTPSTAGTLEGEVVYLAERTAEEIQALADAGRLRGAIVMAEGPQPGFFTSDRQNPADVDTARIAQPRPPRAPSVASLRQVTGILEAAGAGVLLRPNAGRHGTVFVLGSRNTAEDAVPEVILAAEHYNCWRGWRPVGTPPGCGYGWRPPTTRRMRTATTCWRSCRGPIRRRRASGGA